ncbi:Oidioi.mRNA.OKI2018_I69.XSR.g16903.t1.cds [Oikopleura dioica]|uniref:Oidioi.mRNA.OKI2018_I69.XSR.g16903.t1.cds n=1 Tax=Oikopleura dioica TaxID=34765 RepID=A0ABN7SLT2_OIKDI|nr:Oidioi.mRNA.OKI2018_I69.XSR.g16903.t1.cds [Oikopleura dioica]
MRNFFSLLAIAAMPLLAKADPLEELLDEYMAQPVYFQKVPSEFQGFRSKVHEKRAQSMHPDQLFQMYQNMLI